MTSLKLSKLQPHCWKAHITPAVVGEENKESQFVLMQLKLQVYAYAIPIIERAEANIKDLLIININYLRFIQLRLINSK